jgi:hypothetical protein
MKDQVLWGYDKNAQPIYVPSAPDNGEHWERFKRFIEKLIEVTS